MPAKTAFVTGATGFLGLNLVEQLTAAGWSVIGLHRPTSNLAPLRALPVEPVEGDLLDLGSLKRALPQAVDAVFHVAADTSVWSRNDARQTRVNVEGTRNILDAAVAAKARRFIHTSTWNTYGLEQGALHEGLPQRGGGSWINYNRTKFLAEEAVRGALAGGLDAVILNPCHIMGRYDRHGWARVIIDLCNRWIPAAPPGAGCFCHGAAIAGAQIAAVERGRSGENYLLGGEHATLLEVFRVIGDVAGSRVPKRTVPAFAFKAVGRINVALAAVLGFEPEITPEGVEMVSLDARVISTRAEQELGYENVPLRALVEDSHGWLKGQGLVP